MALTWQSKHIALQKQLYLLLSKGVTGLCGVVPVPGCLSTQSCLSLILVLLLALWLWTHHTIYLMASVSSLCNLELDDSLMSFSLEGFSLLLFPAHSLEQGNEGERWDCSQWAKHSWLFQEQHSTFWQSIQLNRKEIKV